MRIEAANTEIQQIARGDDAFQRLMEIPGFGPLVDPHISNPEATTVAVQLIRFARQINV
jgi:hypothetical protein